MPRTKNNVWLMMIYSIFTILILYFFEGGVTIGSFTVMYRYIFAAVLIVIGLFCFLINWDAGSLVLIKDACVHFLPYVLALAISVVVWAIKRPGTNVMTRGGFSIIYLFIALLLALSYVVVFGKNSVYVLLFSLVMGYLWVIYRYGVQSSGLAAFVSNYINQIVTFTKGDNAFPQLEDASIQFAFGALIPYFVFDDDKASRRIWCIVISLAFFAVGMKRIAVLGVLAGIAFGWMFRKPPRESDARRVRLMAFLLVAGLSLYVIMGKYNILERIYAYYGIDTKGRTDFMDFIDKYYYISPTFIGYGLGYVNRLMEVLYEAEKIDAAVLHNDILRLYVEIGFWGFIVFVVAYWYTRLDYFIRRRSKRVFRIVLAVVIYLTVTFLTDNTMYYFNINFAAYVVMLAADYPDRGAQCSGDGEGEITKT